MSRNPSCSGKKPHNERFRRRRILQTGGVPLRLFPPGFIQPLLVVFLPVFQARRLAMLLPVLLVAAAGFAAVEPPLDCPKFKSLCIQAEKSGGIDLKSGTAVLEGNVVGFIRARKMRFSAEALKAFRNQRNEWRRLVLDRKVRLTQPGGTASADHTVLEPKRILLFGNSRMEQGRLLIRGEEILVEDEPAKTTVRGSPKGQAQIRFRPPKGNGKGKSRTEAKGKNEAQHSAKAGAGASENMVIQAGEIIIDEGQRRMRLIGDASIHRKNPELRLQAERVELYLTEDHEMESFRAEGNVRITQPGRLLRADVALSKDNNEVILLIGNARIQQPGAFQMTSQRMEVYTDAKKGVVQSGPRNEPIKLLFDEPKNVAFLIDLARSEAMKADGVPPPLLFRLEPIFGITYSGRQAFETALRGLLTETELEAHLETIAAHAR